jgi:hypothetical protein
MLVYHVENQTRKFSASNSLLVAFTPFSKSITYPILFVCSTSVHGCLGQSLHETNSCPHVFESPRKHTHVYKKRMKLVRD